jgi:magnesium-protoporphyrin O-methyltransferase
VSSCCDPNGLGDVFGAKRAAADARAYRGKGLDRDERRVVAFLTERGIAGGTVLEIGGGVGAIQVDLLRAGAARARNFEISPHYEAIARELAAEGGVADRVERVVADFVAVAATIPPADAVIVHKVVCCYPDMASLVRSAALRTRRWLVLTYPADRWWIRAGLRAANLAQTVFRSRFRLYFHEPREIQAIAERSGLRPALTHRDMFWQVLAMERA